MTDSTLRPEQVAAAVAAGFAHCPYCQSTQIEGEAVDLESGQAWQEVSCLGCEHRWYEIYRAHDIQPIA